MTTTETTVKNAFFNGKPAAKPADTKKADDQTKAQSFGDVLGKTKRLALPHSKHPSRQHRQSQTPKSPRHSSQTKRTLRSLRRIPP